MLVAAVAAVLCPHQVVFVDAVKGVVVRPVDLPGDGLALFAAPDGRVVVPLAGEDSTSVVAESGKVERWQGRVFPMFFHDFDRMHVVMPEELATLSYPERVLLLRMPISGLVGVRRAACSADGRLVAIVPSNPDDSTVMMVAALEGGTVNRVRLTAKAVTVAVAPEGTFAIVASSSGRLEVAAGGLPRSLGVLDLEGTTGAVVTTPDGRGALAGLARGQRGEIVGVRVDTSAKQPLKVRFRTPLRGVPLALAIGGDEVVAATETGLVFLSRGGADVRREMALAGASDVAWLPARPLSAVPAWSEGSTP
jgi:hypothetical protein